MKRILRTVVAAAAIISLAAQSEAQIHASAVVDTSAPGVRIAPEIYGQFAEQLGEGITAGIWVGEDSSIPNIHGYRRDVVEALQALHVPVLRWPGGCYADTYHWRDGIGPRAQRPITLNKWWGNNEEHNAFGTYEYFDFAELIGTKTFLNVNVGTGTAGEANDWVEYVTSPSNSRLAQLRRSNGRQQPWKVDYVGIGNEMWGCGGNLTAAQYAPLMRMFGTFVRQDNGSKIIAVGASGDDYSWTEEMMKSQDKMDVLGLHYYTLPTGDWSHKGAAVGFSKDEWASTFAQTRRIEELITRHSAIMDKSDPAKKVGLAVDEWGTWYDTPPGAPALRQDNTLRDALVAATNFNIFHRHADRVRMANDQLTGLCGGRQQGAGDRRNRCARCRRGGLCCLGQCRADRSGGRRVGAGRGKAGTGFWPGPDRSENGFDEPFRRGGGSAPGAVRRCAVDKRQAESRHAGQVGGRPEAAMKKGGREWAALFKFGLGLSLSASKIRSRGWAPSAPDRALRRAWARGYK